MHRLWTALFGREVEFRVKLFNAVTVGAVLTLPFAAIKNYSLGFTFSAAILALCAAVCLALLIYIKKSDNRAFGIIALVIVLFVVSVPMLFFSMGGYVGGRLIGFVFGVLVTAMVLRGRLMILFCAFEIALYASCIFVAHYAPETVTPFGSPEAMMFDIVSTFVQLVGTLVIILALSFHLYDKQQKLLESQRDSLEQSRAQLEEARAQMKALALVKEDLFANMSHEIRTPLSVISSCAQFAVKELKNGRITAQTISDLETIRDDARRLSNMASGTLDVLKSPIDVVSAEPIDLEPIDLRTIAERVISLMRHSKAADHFEMSLIWDEAQPDSCIVPGDEGFFMRLFWNILFNAVTHSGGSAVAMHIGAADPGRSQLPNSIETTLVTITDNGVGIAPELRGRIFDRGVSGYGGSGLGLSLCRDIVRLLGGEIWVDGEVGKGAAFNILLPSLTEEEYAL